MTLTARPARSFDIESSTRHAHELIETLVDRGPMTSADLCKALGWTKGRLTTVLRVARENVCSELGILIPQPTPYDGWLYCATTEWKPVEAGASHAMGHVESRLKSVNRDVDQIIPHLKKGSKEWQRATFLRKHLTHILGTLDEIENR